MDNTTNLLLMLKALSRAILLISILVALISGLWYFTVATLLTIVVLWLATMLYVDPPDEWN